jgi:hypothetical protein
MVSYQEDCELLTELAGVTVDAKQVERTAEALGKQIAEDERAPPCRAMALCGSGASPKISFLRPFNDAERGTFSSQCGVVELIAPRKWHGRNLTWTQASSFCKSYCLLELLQMR